MHPLLTCSATELARRIREGETSATEVVEAHLARIEAVNPILNAVVADRFEEARREAKDADARRSSEAPTSLPPLLGVPCTIKESIALEGMPNSAGLVARTRVVAREDATPVARLRAAGAIPVGVTNCSEITAFPGSTNHVYGATRNAFDPERSPGGSSGGEGAIVGAGGSPFGIGTDVAGSIRIPAYCNGVFGHKPTGGLVPSSGQFPLYSGTTQRINTTGPLTRRAADLMPLLRILAGPDGLDDECQAMELGDPAAVDVAHLRVFVVESQQLGARVDAALRAAQQSAAYALAARGARVEQREIPGIARALSFGMGIVFEAGGMQLASVLGEGEPVPLLREMGRALLGRSKHTRAVLGTALAESAGRWIPERWVGRAARDARSFRDDLEDLLGNDGVLLFPSARRAPPRLGRELATITNFPFTPLWNSLEMPSTQVPLGLREQGGDRGMPLGVQVIAGRGRDHLTIATALTLEESHGGWTPPDLAV